MSKKHHQVDRMLRCHDPYRFQLFASASMGEVPFVGSSATQVSPHGHGYGDACGHLDGEVHVGQLRTQGVRWL